MDACVTINVGPEGTGRPSSMMTAALGRRGPVRALNKLTVAPLLVLVLLRSRPVRLVPDR